MGNKCWNCARVGKCEYLSPCSYFIRFRAYVSTKEVACLCGISERTLYRKLRRNWVDTLSWIEKTSGFVFLKEYCRSNKTAFVLETNNTENAIKLAEALEKLEGSGKANGKKEDSIN